MATDVTADEIARLQAAMANLQAQRVAVNIDTSGAEQQLDYLTQRVNATNRTVAGLGSTATSAFNSFNSAMNVNSVDAVLGSIQRMTSALGVDFIGAMLGAETEFVKIIDNWQVRIGNLHDSLLGAFGTIEGKIPTRSFQSFNDLLLRYNRDWKMGFDESAQALSALAPTFAVTAVAAGESITETIRRGFSPSEIFDSAQWGAAGEGIGRLLSSKLDPTGKGIGTSLVENLQYMKMAWGTSFESLASVSNQFAQRFGMSEKEIVSNLWRVRLSAQDTALDFGSFLETVSQINQQFALYGGNIEGVSDLLGGLARVTGKPEVAQQLTQQLMGGLSNASIGSLAMFSRFGAFGNLDALSGGYAMRFAGTGLKVPGSLSGTGTDTDISKLMGFSGQAGMTAAALNSVSNMIQATMGGGKLSSQDIIGGWLKGAALMRTDPKAGAEEMQKFVAPMHAMVSVLMRNFNMSEGGALQFAMSGGDALKQFGAEVAHIGDPTRQKLVAEDMQRLVMKGANANELMSTQVGLLTNIDRSLQVMQVDLAQRMAYAGTAGGSMGQILANLFAPDAAGRGNKAFQDMRESWNAGKAYEGPSEVLLPLVTVLNALVTGPDGIKALLQKGLGVNDLSEVKNDTTFDLLGRGIGVLKDQALSALGEQFGPQLTFVLDIVQKVGGGIMSFLAKMDTWMGNLYKGAVEWLTRPIGTATDAIKAAIGLKANETPTVAPAQIAGETASKEFALGLISHFGKYAQGSVEAVLKATERPPFTIEQFRQAGGNEQEQMIQRLQAMVTSPPAKEVLGSRAHGGFIPQTGLYQLHAGEGVVPKANWSAVEGVLSKSITETHTKTTTVAQSTPATGTIHLKLDIMGLGNLIQREIVASLADGTLAPGPIVMPVRV